MNNLERLEGKNEIWIGLAKVQQQDSSGILGDVNQAYTNVIAYANNRSKFRSRVKQALSEVNLQLLRLENAELLKDRLLRYTLDDDLKQVVKNVENTGVTGFSTFHAFN